MLTAAHTAEQAPAQDRDPKRPPGSTLTLPVRTQALNRTVHGVESRKEDHLMTPDPRSGGELRWADLPLCRCSLRHWPEEIADRHVVSLVSAGLTTEPLWVSGDAPEEPAAARAFTEHVAALGVRRILDVRAEAATGSRFDHAVLAAHGIELRSLGVVDHHDAFADTTATHAWTETLFALSPEPTLVHCHMGVNRSASAAVLLLVARGFAADVATRSVLDGRQMALAIYAPAALRSLARHTAAEQVRQVILEERGHDRRLRDARVL